MNYSAPFTIIEIGTSKIKVLIVELTPRINIIANATMDTKGVKRGEIIDLYALKECVTSAITTAKKTTPEAKNIDLRNACLSISGYNTLSKPITGAAQLNGNIVDNSYIKTTQKNLYDTAPPKNHKYVYQKHQFFSIDSIYHENPKSHSGECLLNHYWSVSAQREYLMNLIQVVLGYGLTPTHLYPAAIASAKAIAENRKGKNLIIDIGAGTTDFALIKDGVVLFSDSLPIGGDHITNDISIAFKINDFNVAESIKINSTAILDDQMKNKIHTFTSIEDKNRSYSYNEYACSQIINARIKEIFEIIKYKIENTIILKNDPLISNIEKTFLTGKTAKLKGIEVIANEIFDNPIEKTAPDFKFAQGKFKDYEWTTSIGLILLLNETMKIYQKNNKIKTFFSKLFFN